MKAYEIVKLRIDGNSFEIPDNAIIVSVKMVDIKLFVRKWEITYVFPVKDV
jgi:hypothetical protein